MAGLKRKRQEKVAAIMSALNQGNSLRKQFLDPMEDVIKRLRAEHDLVWKTFGMCMTKEQQVKHSNHNNIPVLENLKKITVQMRSHYQIFAEFLKKWDKAEESFLKSEYRMKRQLSSLEKVRAAKDLRELGKVVVPSSFEWIHSIPYLRLKKGVKQWGKINLQIKIAVLVCKVIRLD